MGVLDRQASIGIRKIIRSQMEVEPRVSCCPFYGIIKFHAGGQLFNIGSDEVNVNCPNHFMHVGGSVVQCFAGIVNDSLLPTGLYDHEAFEGAPASDTKSSIELLFADKAATVGELEDLFMEFRQLRALNASDCQIGGFSQSILFIEFSEECQEGWSLGRRYQFGSFPPVAVQRILQGF